MAQRSISLAQQAYPDMWSQICAFGQVLSATEWLSCEDLRIYQQPLISKLVRHARSTTAFYKDRLRGVDLRSLAIGEKTWFDIPLLTRSEAVKNHSRLTSRKTPRETGAITEGKTSGSTTGSPLVFKKSDMMEIAATTLTERMLRWWLVDGSRPYGQITAGVGGGTTYGWHSSHPNGIRYFIGAKAGIPAHIDWLIAHRPPYLAAYGPVLKELARQVQRCGIELKFELLLSFATVLDEETRQLCRVAFGAEIADTYGAQEVGHIAAQCRDCGEYHISAEATIVEVLRDDGSPAETGEIGRVIVTPLYNYAMPFIRYDLGDLAEVGSVRSSCKRGLPTLRRILGRTRNMFRFRDGSSIWPVPGAFRLAEFIALKQYQVVQTDFDQIEIRYVAEAADRPVDLPALTQCVRAVLRRPVEVKICSVDKIDRAEGGKYEECLSLVPYE
jgi:phenylacetate-CoA ligase